MTRWCSCWAADHGRAALRPARPSPPAPARPQRLPCHHCCCWAPDCAPASRCCQEHGGDLAAQYGGVLQAAAIAGDAAAVAAMLASADGPVKRDSVAGAVRALQPQMNGCALPR